jgi:cytochrome bd ubiquinol oxidase subunit I
MDFDALSLSRWQFGFTIAFHILFPSFTIGLASYLAVLEGLWLFTKRDVFKTLYLFWVKIFALSFGMGVVSGVVLSYEIGTNWSGLIAKAGSVIGPLMAFEVLMAFFLEASFLGIMLFGWKRVGPALHFTATLLVAIGTVFSAFWILSANSWMQVPAGFNIAADGRFVAADWLQVIFSPSFPVRFAHMVLAAYLTTSLVVGAASAWRLLHDPADPASQMSLRMAIGMFAIVAVVQLIVGDMSGDTIAKYQPSKLAAVESFWETQSGQPFHILAWPDETAAKNDWEISIPKLGSLIVKKDPNATIEGLGDFSPRDRPPVAVVFYAFRIMVGLGLLMIGLGFWGLYLLFHGGPERSKLYLRSCLFMGPAGFIAVICGWIVAEVGRQPYVVFGHLRTSDAVSPVTAHEVSVSLALFVLVYAVVFISGMIYITRLIRQGPGEPADESRPQLATPPGNPLGAVADAEPGGIS